MARFALDCCRAAAMTSSFPQCFTLAGSDVIDAVYFLSIAATLVFLLFGPLLLCRLFLPRTTGNVSFVTRPTSRRY